MRHSIGIYIEKHTQEKFEIFEVAEPAIPPSSDAIKILPSKKYFTNSGVEVHKKSNNLSCFMLNEILIHKLGD